MKVGIKVMLRHEVLDTQGRAVCETLSRQGRPISNCHIGKYIVVDIPGEDKDLVWSQAKEMANFVLVNPLIETFELEEI